MKTHLHSEICKLHIRTNKYEWTRDQEPTIMNYEQKLWTEWLAGSRRTLPHVHSPGGNTFLHEMTSWPPYESVMSNRKPDSINRCTLTWRTIMPNFIAIRFETTEPCGFFWSELVQQEQQQQECRYEISSRSNKSSRVSVEQSDWLCPFSKSDKSGSI